MLRITGAALALLLSTTVTTTGAQAQSTKAAAIGFSADTPVEKLAAGPAARAILKKDVPTLLDHPSYGMIKSMSLRQIQPYSGGALTDAAIATADAHLKALHAK